MPQPAQLGAQNLDTKAGGIAPAAGGGIWNTANVGARDFGESSEHGGLCAVKRVSKNFVQMQKVQAPPASAPNRTIHVKAFFL